VEAAREREKSDSHMVKSVLQAKLQRLAILIGYFGTFRHTYTPYTIPTQPPTPAE